MFVYEKVTFPHRGADPSQWSIHWQFLPPNVVITDISKSLKP
nr:MAG TPA: hypothetical protein [Caudoviricetes sp.]